MYISIFVAIIQNLILVLFEDQIISIFTNIESISDHIHDAWIMFNIFVVFDTTQGVAASAMKASGQ